MTKPAIDERALKSVLLEMTDRRLLDDVDSDLHSEVGEAVITAYLAALPADKPDAVAWRGRHKTHAGTSRFWTLHETRPADHDDYDTEPLYAALPMQTGEDTEWMAHATVSISDMVQEWTGNKPVPAHLIRRRLERFVPADKPDAEAFGWFAETGTAGEGDGCNKLFFMHELAVDYVRLHGGHIVTLYRAEPACDATIKRLRGTLEYILAQSKQDYPGVISVIRTNAKAALDDGWQATVAKAVASIAAPPPSIPPKTEAVRVKPLEWVEEIKDTWWTTDAYRIEVFDGGGFAARVARPQSRAFLTLAHGISFDEAKAAAQADYERRILSALASPEGE